MIADMFDLLSAGLTFATDTFISIINAAGFPFAAFMAMLCGFLALNIVLGTLRMRAFGYMGDAPEEFGFIEEDTSYTLDVNRSVYNQRVSSDAREVIRSQEGQRRLSSKYKR